MTGFTIKVRGGGLVLREYRCPDHGVFEEMVPSETGDWYRCRKETPDGECLNWGERCFTSAPAVHTQFVVSGSQGKNDAKPHQLSMDTRPLAEGMPLKDWKAQRKTMWEGQRQKRVMELLK